MRPTQLALLMLPSALLFACEKTGTIEVPVDDTGAPAGDDSADDSAPADDSAADDSDEPLPDPEPDTSVWAGTRVVTYGDCQETLYEEGYELGRDWEYYDWALEYCPDCQHIYAVEVSPDEVCGIPVTTEVYRGLILDEPDAEVWTFSYQGAYALDDRASFDGMAVDYAYELDGGLYIEGRLEFPELPR